MNKPKTDEETDLTKELMTESMREVHSNIILLNIIYKTGRTTKDTQADYRKAFVSLFRDEIISLTLKHVADMIAYQQHKTPDNPLNVAISLATLAAHSHDALEASFNKFKHLHGHLRQDHKQEILNEAHRLGQTLDDWEDS
jgi:hypothetical protein